MFDKHALSLWLKKIGISYKVKKSTTKKKPVSELPFVLLFQLYLK